MNISSRFVAGVAKLGQKRPPWPAQPQHHPKRQLPRNNLSSLGFEVFAMH